VKEGEIMQQFSISTRIIYNPASQDYLPDLLKELRLQKILIVTDPGVMAGGIVERFRKPLSDSSIEYHVWSDIEPDPSYETVGTGFEFWKTVRSDAIVALGGGSAIDIAKGIGVLATNGGTILDYVGRNRVAIPPLPLIAFPTSCGTGSEVSAGAVFSDPQGKEKMVAVSPLISPTIALLDPHLLETLPPRWIALTAMDAFSHALEAYLSKLSTPLSDALSTSAIRLIYGNVWEASLGVGDLSSKGNLLWASTMAGIAMSNARLGVCHAIAHPLGNYLKIPHSHAVINTLFHLLEYYCSDSCYEKLVALMPVIAIGDQGNDRSLQARARDVVEALKMMILNLNVLGIGRGSGKEALTLDEEVELIAGSVSGSPFLDVSRYQPTAEDLKTIIRKTLSSSSA
jgi:alcohol dehydrogenase class IV